MTFKVGDEIEFTSGYLKSLYKSTKSTKSVGEIIKVISSDGESSIHEFTVRNPENNDITSNLICMKSNPSGYIVLDYKSSGTNLPPYVHELHKGAVYFKTLDQPVTDESKGGGKKIKSKKRRRKSKKKKKSKTRRRRR